MSPGNRPLTHLNTPSNTFFFFKWKKRHRLCCSYWSFYSISVLATFFTGETKFLMTTQSWSINLHASVFCICLLVLSFCKKKKKKNANVFEAHWRMLMINHTYDRVVLKATSGLVANRAEVKAAIVPIFLPFSRPELFLKVVSDSPILLVVFFLF